MNSHSVVIRKSAGSLYADGAGFTGFAPTIRERPRRQQLMTTLTLLSLSAWSYALVAGATALS